MKKVAGMGSLSVFGGVTSRPSAPRDQAYLHREAGGGAKRKVWQKISNEDLARAPPLISGRCRL